MPDPLRKRGGLRVEFRLRSDEYLRASDFRAVPPELHDRARRRNRQAVMGLGSFCSAYWSALRRLDDDEGPQRNPLERLRQARVAAPPLGVGRAGVTARVPSKSTYPTDLGDGTLKEVVPEARRRD